MISLVHQGHGDKGETPDSNSSVGLSLSEQQAVVFKYLIHSSAASFSPSLFPLLHSPFQRTRLSVSTSLHFRTHCAPLCYSLPLCLSSHSLSSLFLSLQPPSHTHTHTHFFAQFISTSRPLCLPLSVSLSFPLLASPFHPLSNYLLFLPSFPPSNLAAQNGAAVQNRQCGLPTTSPPLIQIDAECRWVKIIAHHSSVVLLKWNEAENDYSCSGSCFLFQGRGFSFIARKHLSILKLKNQNQKSVYQGICLGILRRNGHHKHSKRKEKNWYCKCQDIYNIKYIFTIENM